MPNQNPLQFLEVSNGSVGPVQLLLEEFLKLNTGISPDAIEFTKFVYYCSATGMYNMLVQALRTDPSLTLMTMVTEMVRNDINDYFSSKGPGDSTTH